MATGYAAAAARKKNAGVSYEVIVRDVRAGKILPVYFLMGEESYYIDRLADFIVGAVLKVEERDFSLLTFLGAETDIRAVISAP